MEMQLLHRTTFSTHESLVVSLAPNDGHSFLAATAWSNLAYQEQVCMLRGGCRRPNLDPRPSALAQEKPLREHHYEKDRVNPSKNGQSLSRNIRTSIGKIHPEDLPWNKTRGVRLGEST